MALPVLIMNGKSLTTGSVPLLLLAVINFALIKEEIDLNVRHKNHGVDGPPLDSQSARDLEDEEGMFKCGLRKYPIPLSLGTSAKKKTNRTSGRGRLRAPRGKNGSNFRPLRTLEAKRLQFQMKRTLRGVLLPVRGAEIC